MEIIDKHAGDVVIDSQEGEGTTVSVRLRLQGGERPPTPEKPRVAAPPVTAGP